MKGRPSVGRAKDIIRYPALTVLVRISTHIMLRTSRESAIWQGSFPTARSDACARIDQSQMTRSRSNDTTVVGT